MGLYGKYKFNRSKIIRNQLKFVATIAKEEEEKKEGKNRERF